MTSKQENGDFSERIVRFERLHPNTRYYIDQNLQIVKGVMKSPWCKLCQKNLDEMRKNDPRCRVIDFCSPNCRKEHNRRKKIRETELAGITDVLSWNHPKDEKGNPLHLHRKDMFYFTRNGKRLVKHYYKAKKGNF